MAQKGLGDHKAHGDDDEVDKELIQHSIDILETVWKQGENDPYWNARMGYAHLMADDTAAASDIMQKSLMMAAPATCKTAIVTVDKAVSLCNDPRASGGWN